MNSRQCALRLLCIFVGLFGATSELLAQGFQQRLDQDRLAGVRITVESIMNFSPPHGVVPLRVSIDNRSGKTRTWRLETDVQAYNYSSPLRRVNRTASYTFTVPDGETQDFDVLAPVPSQEGGSSYIAPLSGKLAGYGTIMATFAIPSRAPESGKTFTPSAVISREYLTFNGDLAAALSSRGRDFLGEKSARLDLLPKNPLGLSGIESVWLSDGEWNALPAASRSVLFGYVVSGGNLVLVCANQHFCSAFPDLPQLTGSSDGTPLGLGRVYKLVAPGHVIDAGNAATLLLSLPSKRPVTVGADANVLGSPAIVSGISAARTPTLLLFLFITLYAFVAGPINLFVLAPKARRMKLYVTTPLIASVASVLLVLSIFLGDGIGGSGVRRNLVFLLPEWKRALVFQEQASSTGLLLSSAFPLSSNVLAAPFVPSAAKAFRSPVNTELKFVSGDEGGSGDWFQSRNAQYQHFQSIVPTRSKVEIRHEPNRSPRVLSQLPHDLTNVTVRLNSQWWKAERVVPGAEVELTAASIAEDARLDESGFTTPLRAALSRATGTYSNYLIADVAELDEFIIPTHPSIRWKPQTSTIAVPITENVSTTGGQRHE